MRSSNLIPLSKEDLTSAQTFKTPLPFSDREYAQHLDVALGFHITEIEKKLSKQYRSHNEISSDKPLYTNNHAWIGLHPQILQTPYQEILDFFEVLKKYPIDNIVDLGSGYGRVGLVMQAYLPQAQFYGIEVVNERSEEANRIFKHFELNNCRSESWNLLEEIEKIPEADLYFIYDFSEPEDIRTLLNYFSSLLDKKKFFLVAKGDGIRSLIQNKYPEFWAAFGVVHHHKWSLYSSFIDLES